MKRESRLVTPYPRPLHPPRQSTTSHPSWLTTRKSSATQQRVSLESRVVVGAASRVEGVGGTICVQRECEPSWLRRPARDLSGRVRRRFLAAGGSSSTDIFEAHPCTWKCSLALAALCCCKSGHVSATFKYLGAEQNSCLGERRPPALAEGGTRSEGFSTRQCCIFRHLVSCAAACTLNPDAFGRTDPVLTRAWAWRLCTITTAIRYELYSAHALPCIHAGLHHL